MPKLFKSHLHSDARHVGSCDPEENFVFTILIRRSPDAVPADFDSLTRVKQRMSEEEFIEKHGAHPEQIDAVVAWLERNGMTVVSTHIAAKQIKASATASVAAHVFRIGLKNYTRKGHTFRGHSEPIHVPDEIASYVEHIVGLDNQPIELPKRASVAITEPHTTNIFPPNTTTVRVDTICSLYNFPNVTSTGQTIAIINGSDNAYNPADITQYFANFTSAPTPTIVNVQPPSGFTGTPAPNEPNLDICVAGSAAPGAVLALYAPPFPFTVQGTIDVITRIVHPHGGDPVCSVMSWSAFFEDHPQYIPMMASLQDAAAYGVTTVISSGDWACANPTFSKTVAGGTFPWVLCVGGTTLGNISGSTFTEWLWNADPDSGGGGGVSTLYPVPSYQANAGLNPINVINNLPGRGVPDISGYAFGGGYNIPVNGVVTQGAGTSAAAPLIAALIARCNTLNGHNCGFINPILYNRPYSTGAIRDINPGNTVNGPQTSSIRGFPGYPVTNGWDAATGWGVPIGTAFQALLASSSIQRVDFTGVLLAGAPLGTVVGTATVVVSEGGTFTGTLSLSGTYGPFLTLSGNNVISAGNFIVPSNYQFNIVATDNNLFNSPLTQATSLTVPFPTLTGITLSNSSVAAGAVSGTVIGAITVQSTGGVFNGTLSVGGTNANLFQIVGTNLCTQGSLASGFYSISLSALETGQTVPFTQTGFTIHTSGSYVGAKAPNSQFWLLRDDGLGAGQSVANAYFPLPSGKLYWDWLFYQSPVVFTTPGAVSGIAKGVATPTSITVSWAAPTTGQSPFTYQVYYGTSAAGPWTQFRPPGVIAISNTSVNVTGLTEAPGTVSGVTLGTTTTSSITINWTAATGAPRNYWFQIVAVSPDDLITGPAAVGGPFATT